MPSSKKGIQGPRPNPLRITKDLHKTKRPSETPPGRPPTVVYEHTPKVIHTSPQEFMGVVQKLTGRSSTPDNSKGFFVDQDRTARSDDVTDAMEDPMLLLTLGRCQNLEKTSSSSVSPSLQFSSPAAFRYSFQKP